MPAEDAFVTSSPELNSPAQNAFSITKNDDADLAHVTRGIYVGGTGDLKVTMRGGGTVTFVALPVGFYPLRVKKVFSTGTTATSIVGVF